jgi:hypothetical protein
MPTDDPRFTAAIARIDAANAEDPRGEELVYSRRMSAWLDRLAPDAPVPLRLAARAQHLRRWTIPRADYPLGRVGYLTWRTTLYKFHAAELTNILRAVGYDEPTTARAASLVRKERIKSDPDAQTLEDVICLVFLENYFAAFARQHAHEEDKVVNILRRTWNKMSDPGRQAALTLEIPPDARRLVERALAG